LRPTILGQLESYLKLWLDHIYQVICNSDSTKSDYLFNWFASLVQVGQRNGVCVVVNGRPGIGKSLALDFMLDVLGSIKGRKINTMELTCTFNNQTEATILTVVDGSGKDRGFGHPGFKHSVSSPIKVIHTMYQDSYVVDNCENFVILTNDEEPFPHDRRFFQIEVANTVPDESYFKSLRELLENPKTKDYVYSWLMKRAVVIAALDVFFGINSYDSKVWEALVKN
jgi:hypothetical protein